MRKNKKKKKRLLKILAALTLIIILSIAGYLYSIYSKAQQTVDEKVHQEVETIDTDITDKKVKEQQPLNILLLGVDERNSDSGRSDALMVLSLKPGSDEMQLVSIPRDTRTEIVGKGFEDKINHAYAYGGVDMSINTVENLLDIDLDYYVQMNMEGLSDLVDALGSITVNNQLDWYDEGYYQKDYHYQKGEIQLDGPKTMGYVRMRHLDPNGDFGRTERQRQVIRAIIDKGASFQSAAKINELIDVLGNNVLTNMKFKDMTNLFANYRDTRKNFDSYMIQGQGKRIENVYYLIVGNEELQKVHEMLTKTTS
ncbi:LCP family protein [Gracilibacillus caseinilyticus]|uniref:LCP family protein n=1 Tax=Gracilibacillus caseinilyticus TaxID=2932256 RepID=A0ABY4EQ86_9BACI|nr:LCP family protein [Gracilibacillus caseinilyticus]UOQ46613.1 LCP family protein [Gracilibacillus caseinilyticus]